MHSEDDESVYVQRVILQVQQHFVLLEQSNRLNKGFDLPEVRVFLPGDYLMVRVRYGVPRPKVHSRSAISMPRRLYSTLCVVNSLIIFFVVHQLVKATFRVVECFVVSRSVL